MKSILRFVRNVWWFRKELWAWWNWDHGPTLALLKRALEGLYEAQKQDVHHVGSDKSAQDIKICIHLLERIIADEYCLDKYNFDHEEFLTPSSEGEMLRGTKLTVSKKHDLPSTKMLAKLNLQKQDTEMLFKIMSKKIHRWWC